jgi:hypothetical protein
VVKAGWYRDRDDSNLARYWDGESWTDKTRPIPQHPPVATPSSGTAQHVGTPPAEGIKRGIPREWINLLVLIVVAVVGVSAYFFLQSRSHESSAESPPTSSQPSPTQLAPSTSPSPSPSRTPAGEHEAKAACDGFFRYLSSDDENYERRLTLLNLPVAQARRAAFEDPRFSDLADALFQYRALEEESLQTTSTDMWDEIEDVGEYIVSSCNVLSGMSKSS